MTLFSRIRQWYFMLAIPLAMMPYAAQALRYGTELSAEVRGFYPVIDEVAAYTDSPTWQVGITLTIPQEITPVLGVNGHDGILGTYAFVENDQDDIYPVPPAADLSHSTIQWYVVPKGTNRETYEQLQTVSLSPNLSGPMIPGEKALIGTTSTISLPPLALGNQIAFQITPTTAIGSPYESPKVVVTDIRFMQGQIDPNFPNIVPEPDPEEPYVKNPGVPEEELPPDPTIGQPKIFIFRLDEWNLYGLDAVPIDVVSEEGFAEVEVDTDYIARVIRDENTPHTATLLDDIDVSDRLTKPINWYLYSFEGDTLVSNAIDSARLSEYEGVPNSIYHTQRDNDQATPAAKSTSEKSEQKLKLRAGFIWDPDDTTTWPRFND